MSYPWKDYYELVGLRNGTFSTIIMWMNLLYHKQGKASMNMLVVVALHEDDTR